MDAAPGFAGLECVDCGERVEPGSDERRCPECAGALEPLVDVDAVDADALRDAWPAVDQWAFAPLLPLAPDAVASAGEGATPLVDCPALADELGVERVLVKDEGQNPTGTVADRELSVAVAAAAARGVEAVGLPSTGRDAVAAAAYGARAGVDVHAFVPTRSSHGTKATVNVNGGDMTVVEGRFADAVDAYEDAAADEDWTPLAPGVAPLRLAGAGTLLLEVAAALDWSAPDAVVYPTGHGVGAAGGHGAARQLVDLGLLDAAPSLFVAQAADCAPIVEAARSGADGVERWERPDTIAGALEVPEPALGDRALAAVRETGGDAVAVEDDAILESATTVAAAEGVQAGVAGGAAAAGAWELSRDDVLDAGDTVVLVNPSAGALDSDVLRSHLMRAGQ